ncbi:MAG: helix-turn-helix domain-containing protein [Planctomycetota bacterium]
MTATSNSIAWQILAAITESTVSQEIPSISGNIEWQLRAAINSSSIGQLQLAVHAGISPGQLSRFTSGQQSLMLDTAARLAAVLGLQLTPISAVSSLPAFSSSAALPASASESVSAVPASAAPADPVPAPAAASSEPTAAASAAAEAPKPKSPRRQPLTEKRLLTTLEALAATSLVAPAVTIAELREKLGADRGAVDALLIGLHSQQKLELTPAGDQPLSETDQSACLIIDGQPHLLCALIPPAPKAAKAAPRRGRRQPE